VSLEELAAAYELRTRAGDRERKISLYRNPINYEHPELSSRATQGNVFSKRNLNRPVPETINEEASNAWSISNGDTATTNGSIGTPTHHVTVIGSDQSNHSINIQPDY
jgi:hypothetical protein